MNFEIDAMFTQSVRETSYINARIAIGSFNFIAERENYRRFISLFWHGENFTKPSAGFESTLNVRSGNNFLNELNFFELLLLIPTTLAIKSVSSGMCSIMILIIAQICINDRLVYSGKKSYVLDPLLND